MKFEDIKKYIRSNICLIEVENDSKKNITPFAIVDAHAMVQD